MLKNSDNGRTIATRVEFAVTFIKRLQGLLGKKSLQPETALILFPCSAIHTFFMRFNIDVLFLDDGYQVLFALENLPPFRMPRAIKEARTVIELPAGTIAATGTRCGHQIVFEQ